MIIQILKYPVFICMAMLSVQCSSFTDKHKQTVANQVKYQCILCGQDCDNEVYNAPGTCRHCGMQLVDRATVNFKTIQPAELCKYIRDHPAVVLLDVRTKEEFEGKADPDFGTLKNAINIPVEVLANRLSELNAYKKKEIIVYCSHSHRSPRASYLLTQNRFSNVINMAGGMSVLKDNACRK